MEPDVIHNPGYASQEMRETIRSMSYQVMIVSPPCLGDGEVKERVAVGSIYHQDRVNYYMTFVKGPLNSEIQIRLVLKAPTKDKRFKKGKLELITYITTEDLLGWSIDNVALKDIPVEVQEIEGFEKLFNDGCICVLTLNIDTKNILCEHIFTNLDFSGPVFEDPNSGLIMEGPDVMDAMDAVKHIWSFKEDRGSITLYCREERVTIKSRLVLFDDWANQRKRDGDPVRQFHPDPSNGRHELINSWGHHKKPHLRPVITIEPHTVWRDVTTMATVLSMAVIQSAEYIENEIERFNSYKIRMRFLSLPGFGNKKYVGIMDLPRNIPRRLKLGDYFRFSFYLKGQNPISSMMWSATVIEHMPWMRAGEIACAVFRPEVLLNSNAAGTEKNIPCRYVDDQIPTGDGNQKDFSVIRNIMDKTPFIQVMPRLNTSNVTARRQVDAIGVLQQASEVVISENRKIIKESPSLKAWKNILTFRNTVPTSSTDLLGDAVMHLDHMKGTDHRNVIKYLQNCPTQSGINIAVIRGFAGTGKTWFASEYIRAKVLQDPAYKVAIVTPSNDPCDASAAKLKQIFNRSKDTSKLLILRIHALRSQEALVEAVAAAKTKQLQERKLQTLSKEEKAAYCSAEEQRKYAIGKLSGEVAKDENDKGTWPQVVKDTSTPPNPNISGIINCFLDERSTMNDSIFNDDFTIDEEQLKMHMLLSEMSAADHAGNQVLKQMIQSVEIGKQKMKNPRFNLVFQSLGWQVLATAGLVDDVNCITNPEKWTVLREIYQQWTSLNKGQTLPSDSMKLLDTELEKCRKEVIGAATAIISTTSNAASSILWKEFRPSELIIDEANKASIPDAIVPIAYTRPSTILLFGDPFQLCPMVDGPKKLTGMMSVLTISFMDAFLDNFWPNSTLFIQRRSAAKLMDIPQEKFYGFDAIDGPDAEDYEVAHPWTKKLIKLFGEKFPDPGANQQMPLMYLDVDTAATTEDSTTNSKYNRDLASLAINIAEMAHGIGLPCEDIAIVTPYSADRQILIYAREELHRHNPNERWHDMVIGTADSMEGKESVFVITNTVVTHELGFVNDPRRLLVMTTRAKDYNIILGNTRSYIHRHGQNLLDGMYDLAKDSAREVCRRVARDHTSLHHSFVKAP